jgi:hypothetical protein
MTLNTKIKLPSILWLFSSLIITIFCLSTLFIPVESVQKITLVFTMSVFLYFIKNAYTKHFRKKIEAVDVSSLKKRLDACLFFFSREKGAEQEFLYITIESNDVFLQDKDGHISLTKFEKDSILKITGKILEDSLPQRMHAKFLENGLSFHLLSTNPSSHDIISAKGLIQKLLNPNSTLLK